MIHQVHQDKQREANRRSRPVARFILSGCMLLTLALGLVAPAMLYPTPAAAAGIPTFDAANLRAWFSQIGYNFAEQAERLAQQIEKRTAAIAFKSALHLFLNNLAYDSATWLAAGGKGQTPYFHTDSWGAYLTKAADGAAGDFISKLGESWLDGFNVCQPDLPFRINVAQGFQDNFIRRQPDCTASELARDWERFVQRDDFLSQFVKQFNSQQNEVLIGLTLWDKYYQALSFETKTKEQDRIEGQGFQPVTSAISGKILTPASLTKAQADALINNQADAEKISTGDIVADAISTFINTLAGKLFQRLFKEGLASLRDDDDARRSFISRDLYTGESGRDLFTGRQAAEARYVTLVDAGIITGGPYELLQQLATCRDLSNPGPEECVIDQNFRLAIEQEMTVREAIDAGYLDGSAPFGFISPGVAPPYAGDKKGYPYRSLLILRAHRIIPVTWEVAAKIIDEGFTGSDRVVTLNALIAEYDNSDSPFYRLIDQYWVLKAPEAFCKAEGYGPVIISDQVSNDGQRIVTRSQYCADYQSCIEKDSKGKCIYGYCTEEQPTWNLQAESCLPEYSTCQTFVNGGGQTVSYLQNTLNYNSCSADNAGCQWYCQSYNVPSATWACVNAGEQVLKPCAAPSGCPLNAGCSIAEAGTFCTDAVSGANLTISTACSPSTQWWQADLFGTGVGGCQAGASCTVEYQGVQCVQTGCESRQNLLPNPGFETAAPAGTLAAKWGGDPAYFERVSGGQERIHRGRSSVRFYNAGSMAGVTMRSDELTVPRAGAYTVSGYVFDRLNVGSISFSVLVNGGAVADPPVMLTQTAKNRWYQVSFDTPALNANDRIKIVVIVAGEQVSGLAWFDDFSLTESCLVNPVTLTLAGAIAEDESKIHFDRDAKQCSAEADGCSQFYASPTRRISNLLFSVTDPSFELYQDSTTQPGDQDFKNWTAVRAVVKASSDAHSGGAAMQLRDDSGGAETYVSLTFDTGEPLNERMFIVSYYAKTVNADDFQCNGSDENIVPPNLRGGCHEWDKNYANFVRSPDAVGGNIMINGISSVGLNDQWQRFSAVLAINDPVFDAAKKLEIILYTITQGTGSILYDDIQLEEVTGSVRTEAVPFQGYTTLTETHLRKAPDYLGCQGFSLERPSDYVLNGVTEASCIGDTLVWRPESCVGGFCCRQIDPPECAGYAPYCQADEIGCQSFTPLQGGLPVPGVAAADDYCGAECVGYDAFKQAPTYFERTQSIEFFIPKTAEQCSLAQAGCDEFTNLDEAGAGGEDREYYQYLRQCTKPGAAGVSCGTFYSWQGSDDSGYQLSTYSLKTAGASPNEVIEYNPASPDEVAYPDAWCDNKSDGDGDGSPDCCDASEDLTQNPFCREFFDRDGGVHYVLEQNTITCSDDCHPYRKTRLGETDAEAQANCSASNPAYTGAALNPGWQDNACVYYAIPDQGVACPAQAAGCREYRGNAGGNVFTAFYDSFEDGDSLGWQTGQMSSLALSVGGHSIKSQSGTLQTMAASMGAATCDAALTVCDGATYPCYQAATNTCLAQEPTGQTCEVALGTTDCGVFDAAFASGRDYLLTFWARSESGNTPVTMQLTDSAGATTIAQVALTANWQYYTFGPIRYDWPRGTKLVARNANSKDFFFDNVTFKEITGYVYAIKNSWQTPTSCDTNPFVSPAVPAPQFMLGCQQNRDSSNQIHNLKSFSSLCREDAVGCEALLDTFNSDDPFASEFNTADAAGTVTVPQDRVVTMVNSAEFRCDSTQEGCQRLGRPSLDQSGAVAGYTDAYVLNDPDQYPTTLCGSGEVGCAEFQTNHGFFYFKAPGLQTCEYRQIPNQPGGFGWFKIGSASATPDCPITRSPLGIVHPATGWTGLCPAGAASCTEFIDPVSNNAKNLIFNVDFKQDLDLNGKPDGWSSLLSALEQTITLTRNTLYTVAISSNGTALDSSDLEVQITGCPGITSPDHSMVSAGTDALQLPVSDFKGDRLRRPDLPDERQYSARFFVPAAGGGTCTLRLNPGGASSITSLLQAVAVRESGVDYVLASDVNKTGCNGIVNELNGCVLFNDRSGVNYKIGETDNSYLRFDADMSRPGVNSSVPVANCGGACDSSTILKVRPDRTCGQWLDCQTKVKSVDASGNEVTYCVELAACDELNESGECTNFILSDRQKVNGSNDNTTVEFLNHDKIAYLSGYAKAGSTLADATGAQGVIPGAAFDAANTFNGYYPFNLMSQFGEVAKVPNGSFEDYPEVEYPVGWAWQNGDGRRWGSHLFRVISSVVEAQDNEGITLQGRASLKLNADNVVISDPISVLPNTDYTLSASINTLNLQPTEAEAIVDLVDASGNQLAPPVELRLKARLDWTSLSVIVNRTAITGTEVRVRLRNFHPNTALIAESSYFDNIQMLPTLEVQALPPYTGEKNYVSRSCRVFPQQDSLACSYRDTAGAIQQGWSGYCLEPDPQRSGVCLQWWPVDLIKGDAFGTYIGYNGRLPLYYCMETSMSTTRIEFLKEGDMTISGDYNDVTPEIDKNNLDKDKCITYKKPNGGKLEFPDGSSVTLTGGNRCGSDWVVGVCKYEGEKTADIDIFHKNLIDRIRVFSLADDGDVAHSMEGWLGYCFNMSVEGKVEFFDVEATPKFGGTVPVTASPNQTWLAATNGKVCSYGGKAIFDKEGLLDQMWFWIADQSSKCTHNFEWQIGVDVHLNRNYCTLLAQTVTPVGENKAWVSRVAEGSSYDDLECTVNGTKPLFSINGACAPGVDCVFVNSEKTYRCDTDANFDGVPDGARCSVCEYNTDYAPFGAAVPEDPYNITNSDKLYWQLPDTENFEPPYQARMGQVPYTYGTAPSAYSTYLKRLFAQSFSFWKWQEIGDLVCLGGTNDGKVCTDSSPQCPQGSCIDRGTLCQGNTSTRGAECNVAACGFDSGGVSIPCIEVNDLSECEGSACDKVFACDFNANGSWDVGTDKRCCPVSVAGGPDPTCEQKYSCSDDSLNAGQECTFNADECPGGTCAQQRQGFQPDLRVTCPAGILCLQVTGTDEFRCGGTSGGALCSPFRWSPPDRLCETLTGLNDNSRPTTLNFSTDADYCAIAPLVKNILINGQNGTAAPLKIINQRGSGSATLLFNAVLDGNQLPLTAYQVDWGDGSKVAVSGTNLRDRSNTVAPYKLTHSYSYYEILSQNQSGDRIYCSAVLGDVPAGVLPKGFCSGGPTPGASCENSTQCSPGGVCNLTWCAVKPRIQIQDNWGWCNGSIDPGSGVLLGPQWGYRVGSGAPNCSSDGSGVCAGGTAPGSACTTVAPCAGGGVCQLDNADAWTTFGGASASGYVIVGIND